MVVRVGRESLLNPINPAGVEAKNIKELSERERVKRNGSRQGKTTID